MKDCLEADESDPGMNAQKKKKKRKKHHVPSPPLLLLLLLLLLAINYRFAKYQELVKDCLEADESDPGMNAQKKKKQRTKHHVPSHSLLQTGRAACRERV